MRVSERGVKSEKRKCCWGEHRGMSVVVDVLISERGGRSRVRSECVVW